MSTLVIGAGVAGLAAARSLRQAGEEVVVLEAKDCIGGRTHTSYDFADVPVELGAEFIHGDRAATWELIRELNLETLHWRKTDDSLVRLEDGAWLTMAAAKSRYPDFNQTRTWALPDEEPLPFECWHDYLTRIGFSHAQLRYVARSFANAVGESARLLSAGAMLELLRDKGKGERFGRLSALGGLQPVGRGFGGGNRGSPEYASSRGHVVGERRG